MLAQLARRETNRDACCQASPHQHTWRKNPHRSLRGLRLVTGFPTKQCSHSKATSSRVGEDARRDDRSVPATSIVGGGVVAAPYRVPKVGSARRRPLQHYMFLGRPHWTLRATALEAHGPHLLQFSNFPLQDRDMLAQLTRHARAQPWRS